MSEELIAHPDQSAVESVAQSAPAELVPVTAGRQLQQARLAAGMSITDVAQVLKFSPRQVELLEQDDYDALPGTTIVRGFVRSYARLLKLDADVLLTLLDARSPLILTEVRPPDNMGEAEQEGIARQIGPVMSVAIVILLAAILLAGWHFLAPKPTTAANHADKVTSQEGITAAPVASPAPPVAAGAAVGSDTALVTATPATGVAPELVFVLNGRSWIEVLDADKKTLHSEENPAGTRLVLKGKAPFDIVVGNAAAVVLTYGERTIDLAPHTRAEVARLRLE